MIEENMSSSNNNRKAGTDSDKYLVTGGAGFIGSNFIRGILEDNPEVEVVNLDKLTYAGHEETLEDIEARFPGRHNFIQGDIGDNDLVDKVFNRYEPDLVVNFAAETHVDRSFNDPTGFIRTNVEGMATLLEGARNHWEAETGGNKFLQVSTDKVYGSLKDNGRVSGFCEQDNFNPNSPYAASKASAEHIARSYNRTYGLPIVVVRLVNVFGLYQFPEKLIPMMVLRAQADEELPVYGDGENIREWIHVKDVCRGLNSVIHGGKTGEVYNIGTGNELSNITVVKKILEYLGKSTDLIYHTSDRLVHDSRCAVDTGKAESEFEWEPLYGFDEKLKGTIDWYLENLDWVNSVTGERYEDWIATNYDLNVGP